MFLRFDEDLAGFRDGFPGADGEDEVSDHDEVAEQVEAAAGRADGHEGLDALEGFHEFVFGQGAVGIELIEHEALRDARGPHGGDVEEDADRTDPEVHVGGGDGMQRAAPEPRDDPVEHACGHEAIPA